jgi:hypothetical protein
VALLVFMAILAAGVTVTVIVGVATSGKQAPAAARYATPTAADWAVTAETVREKCFNSAGCNRTFRIKPTYTGGALDPAATWVVVYEARPVVGGAFTGRFTVTGGKINFNEEVVRVPNADTKLMIRVTEVLPG